MAGSRRFGGILGATAAQTSLIAAVVCLLAACSGDNGTPRVSVPDTHAAQDPPANPQEALLNGEVPLGNSEQPPGNAQQPPTSSEQPNSTTGGGSGSSPITTVTNACTAFCTAFSNACSGSCGNACAGLQVLSPACVSAFSAFLNCFTDGQVICSGQGRLLVPNEGTCANEASAVVDCIEGSVTGHLIPPTAMPGNDQGN
ncbi:MAG TPA: hypothetical protein VHC69_07375 [Polyangiaceae bacterium]|nr:hypothetical protein [Polyangiaceae bacterium]